MVSIVRIRLGKLGGKKRLKSDCYSLGFLFVGVEIALLCVASAIAVMASRRCACLSVMMPSSCRRRFQRFATVEALLMGGIVFSSLSVVTSMTSYYLLDHT